jgi:hypothetical protein
MLQGCSLRVRLACSEGMYLDKECVSFVKETHGFAGDGDDGAPFRVFPRALLQDHMNLNRSERLIQARHETTAAVCTMLHEVCDRMNGMINSMHKIQKASIRCVTHSHFFESTQARGML